MKAVYSAKKDHWIVSVGGEEIAIVDRDHPYTKEILLSKKTHFNSREFGRKLIAYVFRRATEFGLELLLNKEEKKPRVKTGLNKKVFIDDYRTIYATYLQNKELYNQVGVELPSVEEISKLGADDISSLIKESSAKLRNASELFEIYSNSCDMLEVLDISNPEHDKISIVGCSFCS